MKLLPSYWPRPSILAGLSFITPRLCDSNLWPSFFEFKDYQRRFHSMFGFDFLRPGSPIQSWKSGLLYTDRDACTFYRQDKGGPTGKEKRRKPRKEGQEVDPSGFRLNQPNQCFLGLCGASSTIRHCIKQL